MRPIRRKEHGVSVQVEMIECRPRPHWIESLVQLRDVVAFHRHFTVESRQSLLLPELLAKDDEMSVGKRQHVVMQIRELDPETLQPSVQVQLSDLMNGPA